MKIEGGGLYLRWNAKESALYYESKEYVDTALVPLIPISLGEKSKSSGNANEFIQLITMNLETQFKGRILLLPSVAYFTDITEEEKIKTLNLWIEHLKAENFNHLFFISTDQEWNERLNKESEHFIWIPSIPLEHLDDSNKRTIIQDQVQQILNVFVSAWQKAEMQKN